MIKNPVFQLEDAAACGGHQQVEQGFVGQMVRRLRVPGTSEDAQIEQSQRESRSGGKPPVNGTNVAIERWLQLHLRHIYQEVCNEPLPSDLSELVDRFRKRRQSSDDDPETAMPSAPEGS